MKQRIIDSLIAAVIGFLLSAIIYTAFIHPWLEAHGVCQCHTP